MNNTGSWLSRLCGRFLVFEGPDGSGKTTQFRRFLDLARSEGLAVCDVREPGGAPICEKIRDILLDPANVGMSMRCEMLLYMASRAQLVHERIGPALQRGELVCADRFVASTLAYQGAAGGLPRDEIMDAYRVACGDLTPDLNIVFDVDEATAGRRMGLLLDRMEARGAAFHRAVRDGYKAEASADPSHYAIIDATRPEDDVFDDLLGVLQARFAPAGAASR